MTRKRLNAYNCSIARTLDIVGDQWSILIVRDAFLGIETFSGFLKRIGVARNILTNRLEKLVKHNILSKEVTSTKRARYTLTQRGKELLPTLIAIMQWGDKWLFEAGEEPVRVVDRETRSPIQQVGIVSRSGRFLSPEDLLFERGPGVRDDD